MAKGQNLVPIPGELDSTAREGVVASAAGIKDYLKDKTVEEINAEQDEINEAQALANQDFASGIAENREEINRKQFEAGAVEIDPEPIEGSQNLVRSGAIYEAFAHQVYQREDPETGSIPKIDPAADTVWNKPQVMSSSQKATALANLGISGIDNEPVANSNNLVKSGGVYRLKNETLEENRQMVNSIMENYAPVEITGDVTNAADDEDLTSVNEGGAEVLKFKDKEYNQIVFSGLGRVYLRKNIQEVTIEGAQVTKNILTSEAINKPNTIYVIQYDFDLNGAEITIPEGCVLKFEGGSLRNGTLNGNNTKITSPSYNIFNNISFSGTFSSQYWDIIWFGAVGNGVTDDTNAIRYAIKQHQTLKGTLTYQSNKKFSINGTLNYYNDTYNNIKLNIKGPVTKANDEDNVTSGGFYINDSISVFENSEIECDINAVNIDINVASGLIVDLFVNCQVWGTINLSRFGHFNSILKGGRFRGITRIINNYFKNINYFCYCDADYKVQNLADTLIQGNYINGSKKKDGYFWGCGAGNTTIVGNYIDYFRTLYSYYNSNNVINFPQSRNNIYDQFRYTIKQGLEIKFQSNGDSFLNNAPNLNPTYESDIEDDQPYVFSTFKGKSQVSIIDVTVSVNIYLWWSQTESMNSDSRYVYKIEKNLSSTFYTFGNIFRSGYLTNSGDGPYFDVNFYETIESLPNINNSYRLLPAGWKVLCGGVKYTLKSYYTGTTYTWVWEGDKEANKIGVTANRPIGSLIYVGFQYFDTSISKPIYASAISGDTVTWVDATGTSV